MRCSLVLFFMSIMNSLFLLRMIIDEITYAEGGILQVKLKPIFEALRVIKHVSTNSEAENVRKTKKAADSEVLKYLSDFIKIAVVKEQSV